MDEKLLFHEGRGGGKGEPSPLYAGFRKLSVGLWDGEGSGFPPGVFVHIQRTRTLNLRTAVLMEEALS